MTTGERAVKWLHGHETKEGDIVWIKGTIECDEKGTLTAVGLDSMIIVQPYSRCRWMKLLWWRMRSRWSKKAGAWGWLRRKS